MGQEQLGRIVPPLSDSEADLCDNIRHGTISAVYIRRLRGEFDPVLELAARAARLHDHDSPLRFEQDPLSYLLSVLDEVQEWQRPVAKTSDLQRLLHASVFADMERDASVHGVEGVGKIGVNIVKDGDDYMLPVETSDNSLKLQFTIRYDRESEGFVLPIAMFYKYKHLARLDGRLAAPLASISSVKCIASIAVPKEDMYGALVHFDRFRRDAILVGHPSLKRWVDWVQTNKSESDGQRVFVVADPSLPYVRGQFEDVWKEQREYVESYQKWSKREIHITQDMECEKKEETIPVTRELKMEIENRSDTPLDRFVLYDNDDKLTKGPYQKPEFYLTHSLGAPGYANVSIMRAGLRGKPLKVNYGETLTQYTYEIFFDNAVENGEKIEVTTKRKFQKEFSKDEHYGLGYATAFEPPVSLGLTIRFASCYKVRDAALYVKQKDQGYDQAKVVRLEDAIINSARSISIDEFHTFATTKSNLVRSPHPDRIYPYQKDVEHGVSFYLDHIPHE
jgi:hypothetical protein